MRTHERVTLASTLIAMVLAAPAVLAAQGYQEPGQSSGMSQTGQYGAQSQPSQVQQGYGGGQASASGYGTRAFDELDRNNDGYVKKSEAQGQSKLTRHWSTIDQNHDGKLDKGEFAAFEASSNVGGTKAGGMYGPGVHSGSGQGN